MYAVNRVREARQHLGLSQQAVAVKARMSTSSLTMVERYGYCPGPDVRQKIADALDVAEAELWPELNNGRENDRQASL